MLTHPKTWPATWRRAILAFLILAGLSLGLIGGATVSSDHHFNFNPANVKLVADGPLELPEPRP